MARKKTHSVGKPDECAYDECRGCQIQYHAWYYRKGGAIPCGDKGNPSGPLPIRRFKCRGCGRTFSWRPWFLAFARRYMAAAYEQLLQAKSRSDDWWRPGAKATQAVRERLRRAAQRLTARLETHLGLQRSGRIDTGYVLNLARTIASQQPSTPSKPRYACHVIFLALARTRARADYSLTAA